MAHSTLHKEQATGPGHLRPQPSPAPTSPEYATPPGMQRTEFRAMGTTISLLLHEQQAVAGTDIVRQLFSEWESRFSRFLPESELSQLNQHPGTPVAVSDEFYTVLATALTAARATDGVYDPAMLDQLVQLGYDRTFDELPEVTFDPIIPGEPGGRWRGIKLDPIRRQVTLPKGIKLDFGGIAKGMAVDAALAQLRQNDICPAMVNAGGDLAVMGHMPCTDVWPVAVPGRTQFWTIPLSSGAVATSGIAHRHWWQGNTLRHHLLDPRSGLPAQSDLWSVTVVADRCEQAEVAAKVAYILGSKTGSAFLRKQHIAGLLVREDGSWETVAGWPLDAMKEIEL